MEADIRILQTPSLGDRSYLVVHEGWAVAIDVQRDLDRVEEILRREKLRLGAVLETHIHNDYLTGGLALARRHRCEYAVPAGPRLGYSATRVTDGVAIEAGSITLRTIDTAGHTDAHASYALGLEGGPAFAAFTGGSVLLGATGRTDLLGPEHTVELARKQYWSARRLARVLGPDVSIFPTHGFGSFCSAGSPVPSGETIAEQLRVNPAYLLSEDEFVDDLVSRLGDYPDYYRFMGPRNAGGVWETPAPVVPRAGLSGLRELDGRTSLVVDVRARDRWARAHVPGSISIDARGPVATWLGWLVPIDTEVTLIAASEEQIDETLRDLHRIGFDTVAVAHVAPSLAGLADGSAHVESFLDLALSMGSGDEPVVIDTRETAEWRAGHVRGALHVPAHDVAGAFAGVRPDAPLWLYCGVGLRATIAASQLLRMGVECIVIDDDVAPAASYGVPWCDGADCSDYLCTSEIRAMAAV